MSLKDVEEVAEEYERNLPVLTKIAKAAFFFVAIGYLGWQVNDSFTGFVTSWDKRATAQEVRLEKVEESQQTILENIKLIADQQRAISSLASELSTLRLALESDVARLNQLEEDLVVGTALRWSWPMQLAYTIEQQAAFDAYASGQTKNLATPDARTIRDRELVKSIDKRQEQPTPKQ